LNAVQAALALINIIQVAQLVVERIGFVSIQAVNATPFNAVVATRTVLAPIDDAQLAHGSDARRGCGGVDGILGRHG
jgi:hypothetical protein